MSRQLKVKAGICDEIEHFHEMQSQKKMRDAVECLRRMCDLKGFVIDKSKYCELYGKLTEKTLEVDDSAQKEIL